MTQWTQTTSIMLEGDVTHSWLLIYAVSINGKLPEVNMRWLNSCKWITEVIVP